VPWECRFSESARRELLGLGREAQADIIAYLEKRIATDEDPRRFGKPLKAELAGLWRYRVHDYRLICQIRDEVMVVLVVSAGHRRNVYG
jgi:mRNA interferase RelE/StbE